MKTITSPSQKIDSFPDFSGRPRRINLDQILAVKGLGKLRLRPIHLEDEQEMINFHRRISEESIYIRYFEYLGLDRRTSHERLTRVCTNTPESYALVIEKPGRDSQPGVILAVGRLTKEPHSHVATFDTLIADEAQSHKLAKILVTRLIKFAKAFGFQTLKSELLVVDHDMINLCRALHFSVHTLPEDGLIQVALSL